MRAAGGHRDSPIDTGIDVGGVEAADPSVGLTYMSSTPELLNRLSKNRIFSSGTPASQSSTDEKLVTSRDQSWFRRGASSSRSRVVTRSRSWRAAEGCRRSVSLRSVTGSDVATVICVATPALLTSKKFGR